jgi:hypothetical protein
MSIEQVVKHYVESRSTAVVYTRSAIRTIRTLMPACPLDDRQLADLLARHAIEHGYAVTFE